MKRSILLSLIFGLLLPGCAERSGEMSPVRRSESASLRTGSGVAVHPDGLVLTSYHVVADAGTINVQFTGGRQSDAVIEAFDEAHDLAILRLNIAVEDHVGLAPPDSVHMGQQVFTIGYPVIFFLGPHQRFSEGAISSLRGLDEMPGTLQMSVPIQPGNSGGPLLNFRGELVGVVISSADVLSFIEETGVLPQNVNWAMRAEMALGLFDPPPPPPPARNRMEAIQRASRAACLIYALPPDDD